MTLDEILTRFDGVKRDGAGYKAKCPAHDDGKASLGISEGDKGVVLLCRAGCKTEDVLAAVRLELKDLFPEPIRKRSEIAATYDYVDENGEVLFQAVRMEPKDFRQRHHDPSNPKAKDDGWVWNLQGVRRVLYRLPQIREAIAQPRRIFLVEGEKDADAIVEAGGEATCNPMGAGKWDMSYTETLRGAHLTIVVDKDGPGREHARQVIAQVTPVVASLAVVEAKEGKDAADHLKAGHGLADFVECELHEDDGSDGLVILRADRVEVRDVDWLEGFENMLAYGAVTSLFGMPDANKSTFAFMVASHVTRAGHGAIFIGSEDSVETTAKPRLWAAGAELQRCHFVGIRRDGFVGDLSFPEDIGALEAAIDRTSAKYLVVDPIAAHLSGDVDENADQSVRRALSPLARLATSKGLCVLIIKHLNKARSTDPMVRAGGSVGLPGISRMCLLMGEAPDSEHDDGLRVVVGFKNNLGPRAKARVYKLDSAPVPGLSEPSIKLSVFSQDAYYKPYHLLAERKGGAPS